MKNKIKLSLIVLSVLAISANTQAMFRARFAQPQMPKLAHRSVNFAKAHKVEGLSARSDGMCAVTMKNNTVCSELLSIQRELLAERKQVSKNIRETRIDNIFLPVTVSFGVALPIAWHISPTGASFGVAISSLLMLRKFNIHCKNIAPLKQRRNDIDVCLSKVDNKLSEVIKKQNNYLQSLKKVNN